MASTRKSPVTWQIPILALAILFAGTPVDPAAAQLQNTPHQFPQQQQQPGFPSQPDLPNQSGSANGPGQPRGLPAEGQVPPAIVAAAARAQATDRQKRLIADTDKLLALATQLHADVARTDKNILSVDVVRRAEAIEKLARSVKDRERGQ